MKNLVGKVKKISGIIFDWGGVFSRSGNPLAHPKLSPKIKIDVNSLGRQLADIIEPFSLGQMASNEYWQKYAQRLNITVLSPAELRDCYLRFTPDYSMLALLKTLALTYPVALLSNLNIDMKTAIINRLGIDKYFQSMIFSNDVGLLKPQPEIYLLTLQKLGLPAAETLFIDDTLEYITAAQKLGLNTILFTSEKELREELKRLKLL